MLNTLRSISQSIRRNNRSIIILTAVLAGGNITASVLRLISGLLTARFISPDLYGLFNSITLVLGYLPILQLGILNGLNRELPFYLGSGEKEKAYSMAASAQGWSILLSLIVSVCFLLIGLYYLIISKENLIGFGWITNAFSAFVIFYGTNYLEITYRTSSDFKKLSGIYVLQNSLSLLLVVAVKFLGFLGLCVRSIFTGLGYLLGLFFNRPLTVISKMRYRDLKHLFSIGAPIFIVGQMYLLWTVLDSTLVVKFMGTTNFGYYQLAILTYATLSLIPGSLAQVIYPKMSEDFGKLGRLSSNIRIALKPIALVVIISIPIVIIAWMLLPGLVEFLLPAYISGVEAARWTLFIFFVACFQPLHIVFNVYKRQDLYFISLIFGIISYLASLYILSQQNFTLVAFRQSMLIGRFIYTIIFLFFIVKLLIHERAEGNSSAQIS